MTRTPRPRRPGESSPSKLTSPGAWPRRARRGTAAVRRAPPAPPSPSPTPLRRCRRPPLRRRGARVHCGADDGRAVALAAAAAVERLLATAESPISPGSPSYMRLLAPLVFQTIPRHHSPHTKQRPDPHTTNHADVLRLPESDAVIIRHTARARCATPRPRARRRRRRLPPSPRCSRRSASTPSRRRRSSPRRRRRWRRRARRRRAATAAPPRRPSAARRARSKTAMITAAYPTTTMAAAGTRQDRLLGGVGGRGGRERRERRRGARRARAERRHRRVQRAAIAHARRRRARGAQPRQRLLLGKEVGGDAQNALRRSPRLC
jgi:hypothetical protein